MNQITSDKLSSLSWLRAAVLGANDGVISISSLIVGVAAGNADQHAIFLSGVAGLCAGAVSMAAGEYVSVQSQADTENAGIEQEKQEIESRPEYELHELTVIYQKRGLDPALARTVAEQLMAKDALKTHVRDDLGITERSKARPFQAAIASALSFAFGGIIPVLCSILLPLSSMAYSMTLVTLVTLGVLGSLAAHIAEASKTRGAIRIIFWGALAMIISGIAGRLFGG